MPRAIFLPAVVEATQRLNETREDRLQRLFEITQANQPERPMRRSKASNDLPSLTTQASPVVDRFERNGTSTGPCAEPESAAPKFQSPDGWPATIGILGAIAVGSVAIAIVGGYEYLRDAASAAAKRVGSALGG